jgi:antitoxin component of RelBE/YafQ-DinJ toxin-antitoxin module
VSKILSVHLGDNLKNRWVQFCRQSGLTPSAAIRQVIVKLTSAAADGMKPVSTQLPDPDHARVRIELRLSTSELSAIKATAALEGVRCPTFSAFQAVVLMLPFLADPVVRSSSARTWSVTHIPRWSGGGSGCRTRRCIGTDRLRLRHGLRSACHEPARS